MAFLRYKQPDRPADFDRCFEAIAACPVEAIGGDGAWALRQYRLLYSARSTKIIERSSKR